MRSEEKKNIMCEKFISANKISFITSLSSMATPQVIELI